MPSQQHRITQGQDYRRVMRGGRRVGGQFLVTHAVLRSAEDPTRFGYVVSKRVGNAVIRNRVTRRLKGISDELLQQVPHGVDIIFRALPSSASCTYQDLRTEAFRHLATITQRRS